MTRKEQLQQSQALQDELRRMASGKPYDAHTPEMRAWRAEVKLLLKKINITDYQTPAMFEAIRELLPNSAPDVTLIAPGVHIYTAEHPTDADERDKYEMCRPVHIGERCWIGGDVTICPGVTIGDRTVIGAGSVVIHDIPADCVAVGNPCKVIKRVNGEKA